jgi:hypothetical protein
MFKNAHSATRLLISILVALSGLGAIVAGQQYLFLQSENEMMLVRRTLDESFLSAIRIAGGESNPEIAQLLARRQTSIEGTYSGEAAMIRQLEIRAMADTIAWFVVIILSGLALTINWRKQTRSGDPPAASMK